MVFVGVGVGVGAAVAVTVGVGVGVGVGVVVSASVGASASASVGLVSVLLLVSCLFPVCSFSVLEPCLYPIGCKFNRISQIYIRNGIIFCFFLDGPCWHPERV